MITLILEKNQKNEITDIDSQRSFYYNSNVVCIVRCTRLMEMIWLGVIINVANSDQKADKTIKVFNKLKK